MKIRAIRGEAPQVKESVQFKISALSGKKRRIHNERIRPLGSLCNDCDVCSNMILHSLCSQELVSEESDQ